MVITGEMLVQAALTAFFVVFFLAIISLLFGRWMWPKP